MVAHTWTLSTREVKRQRWAHVQRSEDKLLELFFPSTKWISQANSSPYSWWYAHLWAEPSGQPPRELLKLGELASYCVLLHPSSCGYFSSSIHVLSLFYRFPRQGHVVTQDLFCPENWPSTPVATWFSPLFLFISSCGRQHALYHPIWEQCLSRHIHGCYLGCSISPDFISFPSPHKSVKMPRVTAELLRIPVKQNESTPLSDCSPASHYSALLIDVCLNE